MQEASWSELLWGRNGLRSLALAGGVFLHAIDVYIVATILPSVVQDIGGLEYYAWNITLFVVASIMGSALSPKAIDAFGSRRAYLVSIGVFLLGTVVCALAPSMAWLLLGRTCQGFGGGVLLGLSYALIRILFDERLWSRVVALISGMWGMATLAGPAVGGIFAQMGHWRLAFWFVLPLGVVLIWLVCTQLDGKPPRPKGERRLRAPLGKISLLVLSVLSVSVASLSRELIWNVAGVALGLGLGVIIARADRNAVVKLLPAGSYSVKDRLGRLYACVALLSIGITVEVFVPYFLQLIHGNTPLTAGYLSALMSAGWTAGSLISSGRTMAVSNLLLRFGPAVSCLSLICLGVLMPMATLTQSNAGGWWLIIPLVGVGLGIGLCWPHLMTGVFKSAPAGEENIATSGITTVQLYAIAMGATLTGMVANAAGFTHPGGFVGAQQAAVALFVVFAAAPALVIYLAGGVARRMTSI